MAAVTTVMATFSIFCAYTVASISLTSELQMTQYYRDILIDPRTSCTRDEAAAILLGRRSYGPIYQDHNADEDPGEVRERFMEWLDISIYEELLDERDGYLIALDAALENKNQVDIDACKERIVQCDETIRRTKQILCDIDDELAKGTESRLRKDQAETKKLGRVHLTLSSLKEWASDKGMTPTPIPTQPAQLQSAPPARNSPETDEPLLNSKGGMSQKSAQSFLVTFALLLEQFVARTGKEFKSDSGNDLNKAAIIALLHDNSLPEGRLKHFLRDQSVASIKKRLGEVMEVSTLTTATQRGKELRQPKPKTTESK